MDSVYHKIARKGSIKPIGSFPFLLTLHILFLLFYVILMPAFEGADEPDHLRYIEAVFEREKVHPVDRGNPRRYGIEVYQPPLYYHIAALAAKIYPVVFPDHLEINPDKNPNRPYLVHDHPGEVFPFDPPRKTLRFFRTLSLLLGVVSLVIFARILRLIMPENPQTACIILLVAALWPNNLQVFSVVSNDALAYLFNLILILVLLHTLKADRPSWKHGLLVGVTLALGILSKMTMLITIAALFPVFVLDVVLDRHRGKGYLKIMPTMLLPLFLLGGPFIVSRTIWYGSPTGEGLLAILTPALVRPSPLSFTAVIHAMSDILPGRFLADLSWQQLTLPLISLQLFLLWLIFNALVGGRIALDGLRRGDREQILHMVLVLSSFLFMFFALFRISVHWMGMQFRHVWSLWPVTLLAPYFAIKGLKFFRRVNKEMVLNIIFVGLMIILVPVNFLILYNYILMYKPIERVSQPDLDYFTYSDYYAQSPHMASAYLDRTILTDVIGYKDAAERDDWNKRPNEHEARLMCVRALRSLGRPGEALEVLRNGADDSHRTRLLEIGILVDLGRFREARELTGRCLPEAPPDVRVQLESILEKIRVKLENN